MRTSERMDREARSLDDLGAQVAELRGKASRPELVARVDRLLARVARGRGAVDLAIGDRLDQLQVGDRLLRLGYSRLTDYGREVLGVAGRTAQAMARLARELRLRPLLGAAVRRGEVSPRKAETVLPAALGPDEAQWVFRARTHTVRELQEATSRPGEPWEWERVAVRAAPATIEVWETALDMAGRLLGPTSARWERVEVVCQEFLGAHRGPGWNDPPRRDEAARCIEGLLERETARWAALEDPEPVPSPDEGEDAAPREIDARLRELAEMRRRWDDMVGQLAHVVRDEGLWCDLRFASFEHYCEERPGLASRTVEQRAWLEARLGRLPGLREALRAGRVSYEKARIVAGVASAATVERWIQRAERATCIGLRREADAAAVRQTCALGVVVARVPRFVSVTLAEAMWAARREAGRELSGDECLSWIGAHFIRTWMGSPDVEASPDRRAVVERDRGYCQVPGCSREGGHLHHVTFRSSGGWDDPANLVSVCPPHHLHGIHRGWVRVRGRAPDSLVWELGETAAA